MHRSPFGSLLAATVMLTGALPVCAQPAQVTTIHGAWSVECLDAGRRCIATQKVSTDPAGQKAVLGVIVEPGDARSGPLLTFRLSSQAFVPAGAGLKIDDRDPLRAPISGCDGKVCEVRSRLTPELAAQMSSGKLLVFAYFLDRNNQVSLPVSLNGFAAALAKVAGARPAPSR